MAIIPSRVRGMSAPSHKEYSRPGGAELAAALSRGLEPLSFETKIGPDTYNLGRRNEIG
jgi:hypothetical protein